MAKKMISIKLTEETTELLKLLAESESRSQGAQVEHMVKKEADRLKISVPKK